MIARRLPPSDFRLSPSILIARYAIMGIALWLFVPGVMDQVRPLLFALAQTPLAFFWGGCPCCGCGCTEACTNDRGPCEFELVIDGMTDGPNPPLSCDECDLLDGTYILTHNGEPDQCIWNYFYDGFDGPCGISGWRVRLTQSGAPPGGQSGTPRIIAHRLPDEGSFGHHIGWYENVSFPYDCRHIDGLELSNYFDETGIPVCDVNAGTATLTAVN